MAVLTVIDLFEKCAFRELRLSGVNDVFQKKVEKGFRLSSQQTRVEQSPTVVLTTGPYSKLVRNWFSVSAVALLDCLPADALY